MDVDVEEFEFVSNNFLAAYRVHDGKTLVHMEGEDHYVDTWHLLPPPVESEDKCGMTGNIPEGEVVPTGSSLESSHVLESRGELLRVSVLIQTLIIGQPAALTVSVHGLEEEVDEDGRHTVRWVRRDGRSFADRVMFLGLPTSFAVEASRFRGGLDDVSGGWVYFLQRRSDVYMLSLPGVFRYSLIHGKAEFMERLPLELIDREDEAFMWLMPQPVIAPIKLIREES
ncbi:hypothetical protein ACQ4PT_050078 [Festuca glaucescens]